MTAKEKALPLVTWPNERICKVAKLALLIACARTKVIDHSGKPYGVLQGVYNDVESWKSELIRRGYSPKDIHILWDKDGTDPSNLPTYKNIVQGMHDLVEGLQPDQRRFFFFAGHRGKIKYPLSRAADGMTKAILGSDRPVRDKIIERCLLHCTVPGSMLTIVLDTCNVGAPFSMPWLYHLDQLSNKLHPKLGRRDAPRDLGRVLIVGTSGENQAAREIESYGEYYGLMSFLLACQLKNAEQPGISIQEALRTVTRIVREHNVRQDITIGCSTVDQEPYFLP